MVSSWAAGLARLAQSAPLEHMVKRTNESHDITTIIENLPQDIIWWLALAALNCLIFVPPIIFLSYSVNSLWPVLTIVEDDAPPTYERIAMEERGLPDKHEEDTNTNTTNNNSSSSNNEKETQKSNYPTPDDEGYADEAGGCDDAFRTKPITKSLRTLNRTLYALTGWPSLLRGLRPHMFLNFSIAGTGALLGCIPYVPTLVAVAAAPLPVLQLYTAWVHIAIAAPDDKRSVLSRFPSYGLVFRATALPAVAMYLAIGLSQELPLMIFDAMNVDMWDPTGSGALSVPYLPGRLSDVALLLTMAMAYLTVTFLLVIPAQVVLTRVQASLLPAEERAIVDFDRTFRGALEGSQGHQGGTYITPSQAWHSFSAAAWWRLAAMYLKVCAITLAAGALIFAAVAAQIVTVWQHMGTEDGGESR